LDETRQLIESIQEGKEKEIDKMRQLFKDERKKEREKTELDQK
jgi:hypothetical protein